MKTIKEEDFTHPLMHKQKICEEPLKMLEESLIVTLRQLSINDLREDLSWYALDDEVPMEIRMHPFLDRILYQLGRKNMYAGDWVKAQQFLD